MMDVTLIGFILIIIGILMALPFFGIGLVFPFFGDIIDIPISFLLITIGVILVALGGLGYFISTYWWALVLFFIGWYVVVAAKVPIGKKRRDMKR